MSHPDVERYAELDREQEEASEESAEETES